MESGFRHWMWRVSAAALVCAAATLLAGCEQSPSTPKQPTSTTKPASAAGSTPASRPATGMPGAPAPSSPTASKPAAASQSVGPARPEPAVPPPQPIALREPTGTFLDRESPAVLRVMTYNIEWNSIFADVNPKVAARFARVIKVIDPDVLGLQEIGLSPNDRNKPDARKRTADDVRAVLNAARPLPDGATWYTYQGETDVIASKYPLQMTAEKTDPPAQRGLALAYVDLPDALYPHDLYLVNTHHKCCDAEKNDPLRQQQSDGIMAWLRDAKSPGGKIELPRETAIIVLGDFNIVGGPQPAQTVVTGNIIDETRYGPDFQPDWDDTALTDSHPLHNIVGPEDWTWRNDNEQYPPGRLDYLIYTDSVLDAVKKFALDTTVMSAEDLQAAGLEKFDTTKDDAGRNFDHIPLVVDFLFRATDDAGD